MKVSRRDFLSLGAGATIGTALTPLPWKLMDDVSIWTQNWAWTPFPEDGEVTYVTSTCTLCPGGCGIMVRKVNNRAVKIEGLKGHPLNQGGICLLGLSGLQLLYDNKKRIKTPLKRIGKKGEEKFEPISWEQAISEVCDKLSNLRLKGESHTVAGIVSSKFGVLNNLFKRFLTAYGSPNFLTPQSGSDSYSTAMFLMQGVDCNAGFDIENSSFILSFGAGLIEGWGSPVRIFRERTNFNQNGGKLIQIEPRLSNTGAKADKWLPLKPGAETVLALGFAHVIIKESLYKKDFINTYTQGFDKWKQTIIDTYTPSYVSKITGVKEEEIISIAMDFAKSSFPIAICGNGKDRTPESLSHSMAVHSLNGLVGNINRKGGIWTVPLPDYINWQEALIDDIAQNGIKKERIDSAGTKQYIYAKSLLNRLPEVVNLGKNYPINLLFISEDNPIYTLPNTNDVIKAFEKIPFIVNFTSYLDETSVHSDLILPNHTYLERYEDVSTPPYFIKPIISMAKPVISPIFNTKHTGDLIISMAKKLGGKISESFPWDSYNDCLKKTLNDKWQMLEEGGFWVNSTFNPSKAENQFKTASGKFEFLNAAISALSPGDIIKPEGDNSVFPLILIAYDSIRLSSGFIESPPFLIKAVESTILKQNDVVVEINPQTAKNYSLKEGDRIILTTPKGEAKTKVHLFDGIMPDIIALPKGLGHSNKGLNINNLMGQIEDPSSGFNICSGIRAKIAKA
ncbi:MAG: molybdopterin-dependent oxidoreductase [Desulfobacterales bacterium]|nr:molybdopterin-dependent oxidoreductase [Desulfobacterales bacterium]MBF0398295.1 molybdopterin-dependent oxidoreductase [Desulfobacterales bacterium]